MSNFLGNSFEGRLAPQSTPVGRRGAGPPKGPALLPYARLPALPSSRPALHALGPTAGPSCSLTSRHPSPPSGDRGLQHRMGGLVAGGVGEGGAAGAAEWRGQRELGG